MTRTEIERLKAGDRVLRSLDGGQTFEASTVSSVGERGLNERGAWAIVHTLHNDGAVTLRGVAVEGDSLLLRTAPLVNPPTMPT